ncbi:phosphate ABC transporter permease subunit PstC [bacterium]|nr:phosphate ABC transporter permease subunit PstC [bacterium]
MQGPWSISLPTVKRFKIKAGRGDLHWGDRLFFWLMSTAAVGICGLLGLILAFLVYSALPTITQFGWAFLVEKSWDPVNGEFGALAFVFGTVVSSLLALLVATPLSVGIALFLNELAPRRVAKGIGFLIEMLAAIPSVVYGLWGIFVLAPWLRTTVQPFLGDWFGFLPLFQGPPYGVGLMTSGIILAIMVIPTISSLSKEVFRAIPRANREAALALGATRWETMRLSVLKSSKTGIFGAVILGLGRALGETMAVTMVIGNRNDISSSLFAPAQTMASIIANEYAEATTSLHLSALAEVGLALFAVTFLINGLARLLIWRMKGRA